MLTAVTASTASSDANVTLEEAVPEVAALVFIAISRRRLLVSKLAIVFESGGCRLWYDSMRSAVRTAENRPAYAKMSCL